MEKQENKRKPREPQYKIVEVPLIAEVGAGKVVPFTPRNQTVTVAVPVGVKESNVGTLIVRGCSLESEDVHDGDILIFRRDFTHKHIVYDTICVVFIIATGELVAKKVLFSSNNTITLRASGGGIKDMHFSGDDIEIKGIAIGFQRMFRQDRNRDKSIPF